MQPLREPESWCVRSFDAVPGVAERLTKTNNTRNNVQFVDAALGNVTSASAKRDITKFSNHTFGRSAHWFSHEDIHAKTVPILRAYSTYGPSLDVRDVIRHHMRTAKTIALKLDIEGAEFAALDGLADEPSLLCAVSFLFIEYHNLKFNLTKYGFHADEYSRIGNRIRTAMDTVPDCKLRIHWRSFWSACGEPMRFAWMRSEQATGRNASVSSSSKKQKRKGRQLRRRASGR